MSTFTISEKPKQKRSTSVAILGYGLAKPSHAIDQSDAAIIAQDLRLSSRWNHALPALYRKSGVARRGSVVLQNEDSDLNARQSFYLPATDQKPFGPSTAERMREYAKYASPLAVSACEAALSDSAFDRRRLTNLITVSCTGFSAPGVDFDLIHQLGLSPAVQRTHVGYMGCHAAVNAIRMARSIVIADPNSSVLIGAVELCSLHQQYSDDPQQLVANALFADGAASLVIGASSISTARYDAHSEPGWEIEATGSTIVAGTSSMMSWTIGDHGFEMQLDPQVPSLIEQHLRPWLESWLSQHSLGIGEIDTWAIHPGGPRIVQATGQALGLDSESLVHSQAILNEHGNMSSPTILFILDRITTKCPTAKNCVMVAFGPGLCIEAALLQRCA